MLRNSIGTGAIMALSWEENLAISGEEDHLIRVDLCQKEAMVSLRGSCATHPGLKQRQWLNPLSALISRQRMHRQTKRNR
jgi:hypothetical protein